MAPGARPTQPKDVRVNTATGKRTSPRRKARRGLSRSAVAQLASYEPPNVTLPPPDWRPPQQQETDQ